MPRRKKNPTSLRRNRLPVYWTDGEKARLDAAALRFDMDVTEVVRAAVKEWLDRSADDALGAA